MFPAQSKVKRKP